MASEKPLGAGRFLPTTKTIPSLRGAAKSCKGCHLYKAATQTVFGEGPSRAAIMLVGETPGDREDIEGHPFVGLAGRLLDEVCHEVRLDRNDVYLTNVVKHFKFEPRGKRRIHSKPLASEIGACRAWLDAEVAAVRPSIIVCLGATAAHAFLGSKFSVVRQRGELLTTLEGHRVIATYHPSAILRAPDETARATMRAALASDLAKALRDVKPKK